MDLPLRMCVAVGDATEGGKITLSRRLGRQSSRPEMEWSVWQRLERGGGGVDGAKSGQRG